MMATPSGETATKEGGLTAREGNRTSSGIVFLTLGDGDFSYSYDLARYLLENDAYRSKNVHLMATGLDSVQQVTTTYPHTSDLLRKLEKIQKQTSKRDLESKNRLKVTIQHSINALQENSNLCLSHTGKAHYVIFNHPHLGIEDANLHHRFLCHLFHAVGQAWLRPNGGVFCLTLLQGQYERWECNKAADRNQMHLLDKQPFVPPPFCNPQYRHRRNLTGRSFATIGKSITYTFGRRVGVTENGESKVSNEYVATNLPWQTVANDSTTAEGFVCVYCDKLFREERSRRNHVRNVHQDESAQADDNKKRKRQAALECEVCKSMGVHRIFSHVQGLQDHVRAKHTGIHRNIPRDRQRKDTRNNAHDHITRKESSPQQQVGTNYTLEKDKSAADDTTKESFGSCEICGMTYQAKEDASKHLRAFLVADESLSTRTSYCTDKDKEGQQDHFACRYCNKKFRELRARYQHENFCVQGSSEPSKDQERVQHFKKDLIADFKQKG